MELKLINGDYVPDGMGGVVRCAGADALLERVLFRLTARRGQFPLLPDLGSRLYRRRPWRGRRSRSRTWSWLPPGRAGFKSRSCWTTGGRISPSP